MTSAGWVFLVRRRCSAWRRNSPASSDPEQFFFFSSMVIPAKEIGLPSDIMERSVAVRIHIITWKYHVFKHTLPHVAEKANATTEVFHRDKPAVHYPRNSRGRKVTGRPRGPLGPPCRSPAGRPGVPGEDRMRRTTGGLGEVCHTASREQEVRLSPSALRPGFPHCPLPMQYRFFSPRINILP